LGHLLLLILLAIRVLRLLSFPPYKLRLALVLLLLQIAKVSIVIQKVQDNWRVEVGRRLAAGLFLHARRLLLELLIVVNGSDEAIEAGLPHGVGECLVVRTLGGSDVLSAVGGFGEGARSCLSIFSAAASGCVLLLLLLLLLMRQILLIRLIRLVGVLFHEVEVDLLHLRELFVEVLMEHVEIGARGRRLLLRRREDAIVVIAV
jgi:hypothetical protein